jgi:hypothetical protein
MLAALAGTAALAGCGGSGGGASTSTPTAATETPQKLAKLPPHWTRRIDRASGYSIGVPPGWSAGRSGGASLFRSPDRLVAVSLSVDRTGEALAVPTPSFARKALGGLPGFKGGLTPSPPRELRGTPLEAVEVSSVGVAESNGVRQRIAVVVLRRDRLVNFTAAVAANAAATPANELALAPRMVRTLRDYPVAVAG